MYSLPEKLSNGGYLAKPHGFRGEITLVLNENLGRLKKTSWIFLKIDEGFVPFFVERMSSSGSTAVVKLEDVNEEADARRLCGQTFFIEQEVDNESDDFEFDGFEVHDKTHGRIGTVTGIIDMPPQRLLTVDNNGKEILIPFKKPIHTKTDKTARIIYVNLPEGLLEIYM
jgi:16S rRNA processing protein RimM